MPERDPVPASSGFNVVEKKAFYVGRVSIKRPIGVSSNDERWIKGQTRGGTRGFFLWKKIWQRGETYLPEGEGPGRLGASKNQLTASASDG